MSRRPTLVLFCRAPRLGTGKRRLAARVGAVAALRFQRRELERLGRALGRDRRWRTLLAVTPDGARGPWTGGRPVVGQGRGDLGQRMRHALETGGKWGTRSPTPPGSGGRGRPGSSRPGPVVLVGADLPGLRARHVARAVALLRGADVVFGPAEDGGFWLVGLAGRRPLRGLFAGVAWSTPDTLAQAVAGIDRRRRVALADILADVDG